MSEKKEKKDTVEQSGQDDNAEDLTGVDQEPEWVSDLDSYPLREKEKDPKWAVRTVWIWIGFALVCIVGILILLVLGAIYD